MGPKISILGEARHGKDTMAEILEDRFRFKAKSSSTIAAEVFIFDALKDKYGYSTFEECFEDRVNHRAEWYDMITDYNTPNKGRLASKILENNDAYTGMRDYSEVEETSYLFDLKVWVDASERKGKEDSSSITATKEQADIIITNNGTLERFTEKVVHFGDMMYYRKDVWLDVDEVCAGFSQYFFDYFGIEDKSEPTVWKDPRFNDSKKWEHILSKPDFTMGAPALIDPRELSFIPKGYISARSGDTLLTRRWLELHGFPNHHNVYHVGRGGSKAKLCKELGVELFVDDAYHNFEELREAGVNVLLLDKPWNRDHNVYHRRIKNLNEIFYD